MNLNEFTINAQDGTKLVFKEWRPNIKPKAIVALVHGLGDHSGWFQNLVKYFNSKAYAVITFDLRGHGNSEGKRGHIPSYETILKDIDILYNLAQEHFGNLPLFLYGHSFGGNLVINYTLRRHPNVSGVIATGPWLKLYNNPSKLKLNLTFLLDKILPSFSLGNGVVDASNLSHRADLQEAYTKDPLVHGRVSARLFTNAYKNGLWAIENAKNFDVPLLLIHGGLDTITSPAASRTFAENTKEGICTFKEWEGLFHSLHNEINSEEIYSYELHWADNIINSENEVLTYKSV